jgi:hypothetical protein
MLNLLLKQKRGKRIWSTIAPHKKNFKVIAFEKPISNLQISRRLWRETVKLKREEKPFFALYRSSK